MEISEVELETRRRIRLSVAAYAYERYNHSFLSDHEFDELAKSIDLTIKTKSRKLNNYFNKNFHPDTGMWILKHPDKRGLENLYHRYYKALCK